ncbi:hypothetical protein [Thauera butanivorans]|uniref:hypothetical protein n=1 Tax=Thauera butanivorans TaxID=86174 RepID=UPI000837E41F|nr:hypothetical protein [Thauera butanivorans]
MSEPTFTETLLLDLLRSQEAMRLDIQRLAHLCDDQARELAALRNTLSAPAPQAEAQSAVPLNASLTLPFGLLAPHGTPAPGDVLAAVRRDIAGAFHPPPDTLLPRAAYILYRQIQGLDLRTQRLAAITTARTELADMLAVTQAASAVELRLYSADGPLEIIEYDRSAPPSARWLPAGLPALPWLLESCDVLWIPDPFLASLTLRCRGVFEGFAERVRHGVLFSLNAGDWKENDARTIAHGVGFVEVSRPFGSGTNAYVTRLHESQGHYPLTNEPPAPSNGPLYLLASKIPSPAFRIGHADERNEAPHESI